jgi:nicotinate-nucleotide adenylyltransferase
MRLGVMGGTFDPIHLGHLVCASEVHAALSLDQVVFVPAGRPWQKADRTLASPDDRYAMTVLATRDDPRFSVSRTELDRPGYTYTVDTLRELGATGDELFFVVGADTLAQLPTWREPETLLSLATFVGVPRPGFALDAGTYGDVTMVDTPALDISASDCRSRVAAGRPIRYLVPQPVADYIAGHGLYARTGDGEG